MESDKKAPDSHSARPAPAPEPRIATSSSAGAVAALIKGAAPREAAFAPSPAEERRHLRLSVFRT